jgi:radical SAM superfamily enzyme YgiQ (UPF0313 family)
MGKIDAILIQPKTGLWDMMSLRVPESLLAISAVPVKYGYNLAILDQRVENDWKEKLKNYLKRKPLCIGITSMTGEQLKYVIDIINLIKHESNVPIVIGGAHATLLPEQTIKHEKIDIVVVGEGDYTFYEILENLKNKKPLQSVRGIYYKEGGKICYTGSREIVRDLDSLPDYPYSFINIGDYETFDLKRGKSISIITSRGCPYKCKFCAIPLMYPTWRGYSVKKVIEKIKKLQEAYNIYSFYFQDDNLGANLPRFIELITELAKLDKKIKWGTLGIRADTISFLNDEQLELIYKSGCHDLDIGVETGSKRVNKFIGKGEEIETIIETNRRLARFPIKLKYTFIIGFPTETEEERKESIDLALRLQKENFCAYTLFFAFTPVMGTDFFALAVKHGFKKPQSLEDWANLRFEDWLEKYPSWFSKKDISEIEMISFASYFANKNVFYKFTHSFFRILFLLYYPIARLRFKKKFFSFPIELKLRRPLFLLKDYLLRLIK